MLSGLLPSTHFDADHDIFRETVRHFVDRAVLPHIDAWGEAETFPRALYREAADLDLLSIGFPEGYGGTPGDLFLELTMIEELTRTAGGGLLASLFNHTISTPPIVAGGSAELKACVSPATLSGEKISALAITESSGGLDVASLTTCAAHDGSHYVASGNKIFITSGMRADYITVTVRTGETGVGGISVLLMEGDTPRPSRMPLKKMGWQCSDTAQLYFDNCRMPVGSLLGTGSHGFKLVMRSFNHERLALAMQVYSLVRTYLIEAVGQAIRRETSGKRLVQHQVTRQKLVAMATRIEAARTLLEDLMRRMQAGDSPVAQLYMLKNSAAQSLQFCADTAVQLLGGMGFMRGTKSERIYREVKVYMIGGNAEEILSDLAAHRLGWT